MAHYKISDVAEEVKDRENNPSESKYDRFVGLEHYVSGDVEITHFGSTERLESAMKVFKAGDILIARRNVYLKRASTVSFDGLTSGDSIVLRAKDPTLARILPFVLNTDDFWDYADQYSDGTMSKRLSPKLLLAYEFDLPDDGLEDFADLLWAANETRNSYRELLRQTDELVKSQFIEMFGDPVDNPRGWETKGLLELGKCKNGMNFSAGESGVNVHCLGVGDFKDYSEICDTSVLPKISLNKMPPEEVMLQDGDIVFVRSNGNKMLVGRCLVIFPGDIPTTYSGFCIRFRKEAECVDTTYLVQLLKADSTRSKMAGRGANIQNLNQQILGALQIPIPPIELQQEFKDFIKQSDKSKFELKQAIERVTNLMKSLMQQDFAN